MCVLHRMSMNASKPSGTIDACARDSNRIISRFLDFQIFHSRNKKGGVSCNERKENFTKLLTDRKMDKNSINQNVNEQFRITRIHIYTYIYITIYFRDFLEKDKSKADYRKWSVSHLSYTTRYYSISIRVLLFLPFPLPGSCSIDPNLAV